MPAGTRYIHEKEFAELTKPGAGAVIFNFTASWCGPCKMIAPKIDALALENPSVTFVKVDVDENEDLAMKLNVNAMPTFLLYVNGQKKAEVVGANYEAVKQLLTKI